MRFRNWIVFFVLLACWNCSTRTTIPQVSIVVGPAAPELERFAADELADYLMKLFGIQTHPSRHLSSGAEAVFLIGSPSTNPAVRQAQGENGFAEVTDQGIVLKSGQWEGVPAVIVGGGSPQASLWAVYDLVERWGVRYLSDRDVFPEKSSFELPDLDETREPIFRIRAHPTIQDFACSGEAWGIADFRVLLNQLAKMKFNRVNIYPFAYQPYLHWGYKGIERRSAWLWYDYHYPITADMVGRELFGSGARFWNPDLPEGGSYGELVAAGERQIHNLMEHAHRRGMECNIYADLTQFPPEFAPLLKDAQKVRQVGELTIVPGPTTDLDDSRYRDLCAAVLKATVQTYPQADLVTIGMPEWRQWTSVYEHAWRQLNTKYGIESIRSLDEVLESARNRKWRRGSQGPEKALNEVKGDLASLVFYDRLLETSGLNTGSSGGNKRLMCWGPAEELWPLLDKILAPGTEVGVMPDNFQTHVLSRREIFQTFPTSQLAATVDLTLDDDNIGLLPQITMQPVHELVTELGRHRWAGFTARERFPADHDWLLAYLARAAWDTRTTPENVAEDFLAVVCGDTAAGDMLTALRAVEAATALFEGSDYGFAFPVPGMLTKHWKAGPVPGYLPEVRGHYQRGLEAARRANEKSRPAGRYLTDFWVGRLEFAVSYVESVETVRRAATAESGGKRQEALAETKRALELMRRALEAYSRVARNRSDLGAIAIVNEYGYRVLKQKIAELGS